MDDTVDNHDERARRAADLYTAAAERRHEKPGHDGCHDARFGRNARRYAERNGQGERHDAHDEARHHIGRQRLAVVVAEVAPQLWFE